ncbi:hypothetical protein HYH03_014936 [Edaphochlamys debaryana]|uniref:Uncharacterized protein n=1 Tax=Edaphochlamys debaryana TaxID=47281 RepID=A0A836BRN2_9CHLO|nr:hypothetical protein HYH03_014936 [Edaphochlamys debaryana]|eukprot:KAG2486355.1 hypothetical protein HYH03_014936 [Edaphochlamys debaryana]
MCSALALAPASPAALGLTAAPDPEQDTLENIPASITSAGSAPSVPLSSVIGGPQQREIEGCTRKCIATCVRGGEGAPGLGPLSLRKEEAVFKQGFRTRSYCLSECAQLCALKLGGKAKADLLGVGAGAGAAGAQGGAQGQGPSQGAPQGPGGPSP